jgi:hypothetical protein
MYYTCLPPEIFAQMFYYTKDIDVGGGEELQVDYL